MKLSWSHKLFLKINQQIGARPKFDRLMYYAAHWLIYFFVVLAGVWGILTLEFIIFLAYIKLLATASVFSIATSWIIGIVWPHRRPILEFPQIKQLLTPYKTWKAFPSDHTIISFLFVFISLFIGASWYVILLFFLFATSIGCARVYVGVHYPRDIIGGFVLALVYSLAAYWLLSLVTQPLYDWFLGLF